MHTYSQRLLNPFRGIMSIIENEGAEAVTTDGVHWDIYVRDTALVEDLEASHKVQTRDIRYGSWSVANGLKRGAIHPSDDFCMLEHRGALVYEYLLKHHAEVPFPLRDCYECWLLAEDGLPLALLHSVVREQDMELDCYLDWRAGHECRETFHSDLVQSNAGVHLTRYINQLAASGPRAQWFQRQADGSGVSGAGINGPGCERAHTLPKMRFPRFFVREDVAEPVERQLIQEFLLWQAPCLLLLQHGLDAELRCRLEQSAIQRAQAVDRLFHLYPCIMDQDAINVARVEAMLRSNEPAPVADVVMSTDYIELSDDEDLRS